jgi:hypothetical protein
MCNRKGKNIKDLLVKANIAGSGEDSGTFPCGRARCLTCHHTNKESVVTGPAGSWNIKSSYTCVTKNVVYTITCSKCAKLYVGETMRLLAERFREHLRDVKNKVMTSPVAQHFSGQQHTMEDMTVGVLQHFTCDRERKQFEMRLIKYLGTLDPAGMNLDFSYNV